MNEDASTALDSNNSNTRSQAGNQNGNSEASFINKDNPAVKIWPKHVQLHIKWSLWIHKGMALRSFTN
jgi:hypothetical protein